MKFVFLPLIVLSIINMTVAQDKQDAKIPKLTEVWEPKPRVVETKAITAPPSDAIILFDGSNFDQWETQKDGSPVKWKLEGDAMVVQGSTGDIQTKQSFDDIQLHIEWRTPKKVEGEGQARGNSGVFLQNKYEIQILDSYKNETYPNGQAGAIYKQYIPLVNASKGPGEWQAYDIIFHAPVFNKDGIRVKAATMTVLHNGVLIQDHITIYGTTEYIGIPKNEAHGKLPIKLQDHGNPTSFRNIWVREL